jgi:hypothetical protein
MPRAAFEIGAAEVVAPLDEVADALVQGLAVARAGVPAAK